MLSVCLLSAFVRCLWTLYLHDQTSELYNLSPLNRREEIQPSRAALTTLLFLPPKMHIILGGLVCAKPGLESCLQLFTSFQNSSDCSYFLALLFYQFQCMRVILHMPVTPLFLYF